MVPSTTNTHNTSKKEDLSLWAIQAHRQDHILKVWRHENGSTAVSISNSFKHLMMMAYVV
jgi:hypothetical protein